MQIPDTLNSHILIYITAIFRALYPYFKVELRDYVD